NTLQPRTANRNHAQAIRAVIPFARAVDCVTAAPNHEPFPRRRAKNIPKPTPTTTMPRPRQPTPIPPPPPAPPPPKPPPLLPLAPPPPRNRTSTLPPSDTRRRTPIPNHTRNHQPPPYDDDPSLREARLRAARPLVPRRGWRALNTPSSYTVVLVAVGGALVFYF